MLFDILVLERNFRPLQKLENDYFLKCKMIYIHRERERARNRQTETQTD